VPQKKNVHHNFFFKKKGSTITADAAGKKLKKLVEKVCLQTMTSNLNEGLLRETASRSTDTSESGLERRQYLDVLTQYAEKVIDCKRKREEEELEENLERKIEDNPTWRKLVRKNIGLQRKYREDDATWGKLVRKNIFKESIDSRG
jgi:hypothetical protein